MIKKQKMPYGLETFILSSNGNIVYIVSVNDVILQIETIDLNTYTV